MTTTTYDLYLESGPRYRTTMVHVLDPELLGCVAVGPTTAAALAATPEAIRAFGRFLHRHGELVDTNEPFQTQVAEHITEGEMLGSGSPYLLFGPDLAPLSETEIDSFLRRSRALRGELADWTATQTDELLDALPDKGRSKRAVLLHVLGATGPSLSGALGTAPGFHAARSAAERGELSLADALRRTATMATERVLAATPEERMRIRELPGGRRTLRQALRHLLEHDWEHMAELSRRPNGPLL